MKHRSGVKRSAKKVVIDLRIHQHSGIGRYALNLVPYLVERCEVSVIGDGRELRQYAWYTDVSLIQCSLNVFGLGELLFLWKYVPVCDVFWSPHFNTTLFSWGIKNRMVTLHDVYMIARPEESSFVRRWYAKFLINLALKQADTVMTISDFSIVEIKRYFNVPQKLHIVYPAVNPQVFYAEDDVSILNRVKQDFALEHDFALFVGNVKPNKNLRQVILAVKELGVSLIVIGKQTGFKSGEQDLDEFIKHYGMSERVRFLGFVNDDKLRAMYSLASVFVFASLYEGFGIPVLEAQRCGCPVVCSDIPCFTEISGESVVLVNPHQSESIATGIKHVLHHPDFREKLIQKGYENSTRYSWEKSAARMLQLIEGNA